MCEEVQITDLLPDPNALCEYAGLSFIFLSLTLDDAVACWCQATAVERSEGAGEQYLLLFVLFIEMMSSHRQLPMGRSFSLLLVERFKL
jgi:hypothetical protein